MGKAAISDDVRDAVMAIMGIVEHLVDHPESVEVNLRPGACRLGVELYTDPDDVGQVVGRNGYLGTSLRAFIAAVAGKHKVKIDLDYVTEEANAKAKRERQFAG